MLETDMRCLWKLTTSALWSEGAGDQCLPGTWRAEPSSSHPLISSASMQVAGSLKEVKEALVWFTGSQLLEKHNYYFFFAECEPELLNLLSSTKSPASYLQFSVWRSLVFTKDLNLIFSKRNFFPFPNFSGYCGYFAKHYSNDDQVAHLFLVADWGRTQTKFTQEHDSNEILKQAWQTTR